MTPTSKTLQLISIQHELGMAIGLDLRLKPMLRHFTQACIRRLSLAGMHYYFRQNATGEFVLPDHLEAGGFGHFLSVPDGGDDARWRSLPPRFAMAQAATSLANDYHVMHEDGDYLYCFNLQQLGIVVLHRFQPIDAAFLELLKPIFKRLAISCQASIEHEQLLHAIEGRKKAEDTILFQLYHDELTRLPNRRMLMDTLMQDIHRSQRHGHFGALLYIDLDRFKTVNDMLGHATGDDLLVAVSAQLTELLRREDTVARLSGDEFIVLLPELDDSKAKAIRNVQAVIDKLHQAFAKPVHAGNHILHITLSIGVEIYPHDDATPDQILRNADTAMYQAKTSGPNAAVFYDRNMSRDLEARLAIEKEMQDALKQLDQFELHYQPQCSYGSELIGAEALIRWNNPLRGMVSPGLFIPVAEETGMMIDVGRWVIAQACDQLRRLEQSGLPPSFGKLSVNVSAVQFKQPQFIDDLLETVHKSSIDPRHLGIELTESTLIKNINDTVDKMARLRDNGIHISVDDFGTGYSSLAYLNRFPIGTLKIDQAFVRNIHVDNGNRAIVETIVALAHSLDLSIIAEGVETRDELECLHQLECENYQGFYFSRPVAFEQFTQLVHGRTLLPAI